MNKLSYQEVHKKYGINLSTIKNWCHVYSSNFDHMDKQIELPTQTSSSPEGNPHEVGIHLKELELAKLKIAGLEMMIKIAEKEFNIDIRKKSGTKQ